MFKKILTIGFSLLFLSACNSAQAKSPTTANQAPSQVISLDEVAKHSSATDCWMVIEDKVYNVTNYIPQHPGGNKIVSGCGKDATEMFNRGPHGDKSRNVLSQFQVGVLAK